MTMGYIIVAVIAYYWGRHDGYHWGWDEGWHDRDEGDE